MRNEINRKTLLNSDKTLTNKSGILKELSNSPLMVHEKFNKITVSNFWFSYLGLINKLSNYCF